MKRRILLGVISAGLTTTAGCLGDSTRGDGGGGDDELAIDSVGVERDGSDDPAPVEFGATVVRERIAPGSPGRIRFSVHNAREEVLEVATGPVPPFGVLAAEATDGSGRFPLWHDDYRESSHVQVEDGNVSVADVARRFRLEPGATATSTYEVRHDPGAVSPGTYRVVDLSGLGLRFGPASYAVTLRIRAAGDA